MDSTMRSEGGTGAAGPHMDVEAERPRVARVAAALLSAGRGFALTFLTVGVSLILFALTLVTLVLTMIGIGVFTTPWVLAAVRAHANHRRLLARDWAGVEILSPYRPLPRRAGLTGHVEHCMALLKDPATWRDLLWLFVDGTAGMITALLPAALVVYGIEGWALFLGLWRAVRGGYWYGFIPVDSFAEGIQCGVLGTLILALAVAANPRLLRAHFLLARTFLAPTKGARLAERVERLYETRHDAVDSSAAELRRIERDLHDGAQARLVAMGMSLGTIEALIEQDPAKAKRLVAQARENSAEALTELRDLVRGIHPPVLAERGLPDALRALALRMQIPVEDDIDLPGRFEEPVESAVYFAVSEVLTNAAKHAGAARVWLDVSYSYEAGGMLRVAVTDDGKGGADLTAGTGLTGVERRLGQFDGILALNSPPGGPTMITLELPTTPL